MLDPAIISACERQAARVNVPAAYLLAFVEVESNGQVFVPGTSFPVIRWEGHYFHRRLAGHSEAQAEAVRRNLAHPSAGGVPNPSDQNARYSLLHDARAVCEKYDLSPDLANECISIGIGQVMGAHWKKLGYGSAAAMLDAAQSGAEAQVEMMVRYLTANDLADALRNGRWAEVARGYNGPGYARNAYDVKLKQAADRWAAESGSSVTQHPILRPGASGPLVRVLQNSLTDLGYSTGSQDGHFGPMTRAAVLAFQADHDLRTDGVAGPKTWAAMEKSEGRPISETRKKATTDDLRREGSSTIKSADVGTVGGVALGGAGAAGGLSETLSTAERGIGTLERVKYALRPFWDTISDFLPFILIAVGVVVVWQMYRVKKARVEDHRKGRNLGR